MSQPLDKLIPNQKPTGSIVIPKIFQDNLKARDALNKNLFTGAVVDDIEEDMVIEGLQEKLELEAVLLSSKSC